MFGTINDIMREKAGRNMTEAAPGPVRNCCVITMMSLETKRALDVDLEQSGTFAWNSHHCCGLMKASALKRVIEE